MTSLMVILNTASAGGSFFVTLVVTGAASGGKFMNLAGLGACLVCALVTAAAAYSINMICSSLFFSGRAARNCAIAVTLIPVLASFLGLIYGWQNPEIFQRIQKM